MSHDQKPTPVSGLQLERYVLGALSDAERKDMDARVAADPALAIKVERIRSQDQAFAVRFPAETVVPEIQAAARPEPKTRAKSPMEWLNGITIAFPMGGRRAFAFALMLLLAAPLILWNIPSGIRGERLKGKQAELRLYRNTDAGAERVASGSQAAAGDVFQVEFHPGTYAYGAVVSLDGNGSVTLHWPVDSDGSTALSALSGNRLPSSFQLDDSPRFERFHLLLFRKPPDLAAWRARVGASAGRAETWLAAQAPDSVSIVTFTLIKKP